MYCPNAHPSKEIIKGLSQDRPHVILTGDFNSRHWALGSTGPEDKSGEDLVSAAEENEFILLNDHSPTYRHESNGKEDILDLMFVSRPVAPTFKDFWVGEQLGSDHYVINGSFTYDLVPNVTANREVMLFHKANWLDINDTISRAMHEVQLDDKYTTKEEIDQYVDKLTSTIFQTIDTQVPRGHIRSDNIGIPADVRELISQKRHQRRQWQKTRIPQHKTNMNRLQKQIRNRMRELKDQTWRKYCNDMELGERQDSSWINIQSVMNPKGRSISYPVLTSTDQSGKIIRATTTDQKLDMFTDQLESAFTFESENHTFDEEVKETVESELTAPNIQDQLTFRQEIDIDYRTHEDRVTLSEIQDTIRNVNVKKAKGPDNISNKTIKNIAPSLTPLMYYLVNVCSFHGYHPWAWKKAWALMILKPHKLRCDPGSYRPISLISCLSKIMESILARRLRDWAEDNGILPPEQNGFRKNRSCNDSLFELTQLAMQTTNRHKQYLGTVFFDIEKAFDKVWHGGLRHILLRKNAPVLLVRWISSYLTDRTLQVRIRNNTSRTIHVNYGVPQGSPISPLLFIIFLNNFRTPEPRSYRSLYADDLHISASGNGSINTPLVPRLQALVDDTREHFNAYRETASMKKTCQLLFVRGKLHPDPHSFDVNYGGQVITRVTQERYLGIIFDPYCSFLPHYRDTAKRARTRLYKLSSISNTTYGPCPKSLIRLYKMYVRSLYEYGAPATIAASKYAHPIWESQQLRFISRALDIPTYIHGNIRRAHANLPTIQDVQMLRARQWFARARQQNDHITDFILNRARHYNCDKRPTPLALIRKSIEQCDLPT